MRHIEYWLLGLVAGLIAFVGVQAVRARAAATALLIAQQGVGRPSGGHGRPHTISEEAVSSTTLGAGADVNGAIRHTGAPAPLRNLVTIRRRIADDAPGTYILDMLASQDSTLYRWPDGRTDGIKVWVQSEPHVRDWWTGYAQVARDVFAEWQQDGFPLRFEFALDSTTADIGVRWIDQFPPQMGRRIGSTRRTSDQNGTIVSAEITVAIHDAAGRTFPPGELTGILRHEIGHALGLGHSRDRSTIMYPEEATIDIAPADVATLKLLYALPSGSVK